MSIVYPHRCESDEEKAEWEAVLDELNTAHRVASSFLISRGYTAYSIALKLHLQGFVVFEQSAAEYLSQSIPEAEWYDQVPVLVAGSIDYEKLARDYIFSSLLIEHKYEGKTYTIVGLTH